jgi:type 1 glutamine amidotransferase
MTSPRLLAALVFVLIFSRAPNAHAQEPRVLIFTKQTAYVHKMTPISARNLTVLLQNNHIAVDVSDDSRLFTNAGLKPYRVLIFLNNSGDLFTPEQRAAFVNYIHAGGGFVGLHASSTAEPKWPWYQQLLGAKFRTHPWVQKATVTVLDPTHPAVHGLPASWTRSDEWYEFQQEPVNVTPLLTVSETRWHGDGIVEQGTRGGAIPPAGDPAAVVAPHVICWCHEFEGGRAFYSAMGHFAESYFEPEMRTLVLSAVRWAGKMDEQAAPAVAGSPVNSGTSH